MEPTTCAVIFRASCEFTCLQAPNSSALSGHNSDTILPQKMWKKNEVVRSAGNRGCMEPCSARGTVPCRPFSTQVEPLVWEPDLNLNRSTVMPSRVAFPLFSCPVSKSYELESKYRVMSCRWTLVYLKFTYWTQEPFPLSQSFLFTYKLPRTCLSTPTHSRTAGSHLCSGTHCYGRSIFSQAWGTAHLGWDLSFFQRHAAWLGHWRVLEGSLIENLEGVLFWHLPWVEVPSCGLSLLNCHSPGT